jgi:hypothetical protein
MMEDPDRGSRTPQILLIAGVALAVISVIAWFTVGSGNKSNHDSKTAGTCQLPSGAKAGTEPLPAFVTTLTAPLGVADTMWTKSVSGVTVYSYCFNAVKGQGLIDTIGLLTGHGYTKSADAVATTQVNFTNATTVPYGVSLNVSGDLDVTRTDPVATGGLSIVWMDSAPPDA